jgi:hypothetical protein
MTIWRSIVGLIIGLFGLYWFAVVVVRSAFGIDLPNPADLLPREWRGYLP